MGTTLATIHNTSPTSPYTLVLAGIYCYYGVCPVVGGMLQPTYGARPQTPMPFPCTMTGWHHVALFLQSFYAPTASIFDQKNYGTRTDIARGHSFRPLRPISSLLRLKMHLWRDYGIVSDLILESLIKD